MSRAEASKVCSSPPCLPCAGISATAGCSGNPIGDRRQLAVLLVLGKIRRADPVLRLRERGGEEENRGGQSEKTKPHAALRMLMAARTQ